MDTLRIGEPDPARAFRRGDLHAGERWAASLERDPRTRVEARAVLERVLRRDPGRIGAIRALRRVLDALGDSGGARAVASLLRLFDPSIPKRRSGTFERIVMPRPDRLEALLAPRAAALEELFGIAWASFPALAGPEPEPPSRAGGEELVTAIDLASRILRLPPARVFEGGPVATGAVPLLSRRPAIVVGAKVDARTPEGMFQLGRALFATRPGIAIALATPPESALAIHEAVAVAFGPAPEGYHPICDGAGSLVPYLWGLPLPAQRRLQALCSLGTLGKPADWLLAMRQSANRAGLLVAGDAAACLRVVAEERIRGFQPTTPAAYRAAVDASRDFSDLAAFALSSAYGALRG